MDGLKFMMSINLLMNSCLLLKNINIDNKINSILYQINRLKRQNISNDTHNDFHNALKNNS
jgi:hypothetical protein